ncbi:MAG: hypothetical protein Unbinned221contig1000_6 [Prokaryotic dsDNA virus sp.]|nr:MAG: hypothetical protein Unbinned221contig1000_6 [Prokaryotic dsDNA virus sp.]
MDKEVNIKFTDNAEKTTKNVKSMNESFYQTKKAYDSVLKSGKSFDKQLQDIDKIVKETPLNVRDMNKQIQAYQSIALSAGRETPIGREALEKASQLRDKYVDIQNETKRLADDHRTLNGVMELASIGVAGYGAVQGAMALTGVESEALQKSMQKLMAAQTLLNSVNTIAKSLEKESASMLLLKDIRTKALTKTQAIYTAVTGKATQVTKLFKLALASTGIGVLVVGIGLLIANFEKLTSFFSPVIDGFKAVGDFIGITNFAEDEQNEARKRRHAEYMERKKVEQAIDKATFDAKQKQYDNEIALLESQGKDSFKLRQQKIKDSIEASKVQIENLKKVEKAQIEMSESLGFMGKRLKNESKQTRADIIKLTSEIESLETSLTVNENKENQKRVKNAQASNTTKLNNYKKHTQDRKNAARKIEDLQNSLMKEGIEKDLEINKDKFERLRVDTLANTNLTETEKQSLIELYNQQEIQQAEKISKKYLDIEKAKNDKIKEEKEQSAKELRDSIEAQTKADLERINQVTKDSLNRQATENLTQSQIEINAVNNKYDTLKQLAEQYGKDTTFIERERSAELSKINTKTKNEQIANAKEVADARLSMASDSLGAIGELATAFAKDDEKSQEKAFKVNKAVGIAQAVVSTAQGIMSQLAVPQDALTGANFIKAGIVATTGATQIATIAKSKFKGSSGNNPEPPQVAKGGSAQAPSFNVVGNNSVNQLAEIQQQPTKAYVVSSEVTSAQALDRKVEDFATL